MTTSTITTTLEAQMSQMKEAADPELRICRRIEIGKVIHQGDVYLHRVADDHRRGEEIGTRQVAVGDTVGSRHIAEGKKVKVHRGEVLPEWVDFKDVDANRACLGPVIEACSTLTLTHPEHAHHQLPRGFYQVTYQVDLRTRQAVQD